jgi:hypothetical protein
VSDILLGGESDNALALGTGWMIPLPGGRFGGLRGAGAGAGAREADIDTAPQAGAMRTGLKIRMAVRGGIPQIGSRGEPRAPAFSRAQALLTEGE